VDRSRLHCSIAAASALASGRPLTAGTGVAILLFRPELHPEGGGGQLSCSHPSGGSLCLPLRRRKGTPGLGPRTAGAGRHVGPRGHDAAVRFREVRRWPGRGILGLRSSRPGPTMPASASRHRPFWPRSRTRRRRHPWGWQAPCSHGRPNPRSHPCLGRRPMARRAKPRQPAAVSDVLAAARRLT